MTTLIKWSPFTEIDSMERRMRRAFEEVGLAPLLVPAADIYETTDEFVIELEVPGYEEKELGIEVTDHMVTVKGERKETKEEVDRTFRLRERLEREFERRFAFPGEADVEHLKAVYSKGVLSVSAPKRTAATPTKVVITSA